jgi:hypothetical protein
VKLNGGEIHEMTLIALLTGFDGLASLPRLWRGVWGLATLIACVIVLHYLLGIQDATVLLAWKDTLVCAAPWTLSICALPFLISKVTGSLEGIVQSLSGGPKGSGD